MVEPTTPAPADWNGSRLALVGIFIALLSVGCFAMVRSLTATHQPLCLLVVLAAIFPLVRLHTDSIPSAQQDYYRAYGRALPLIALVLALLTAAGYLLTMHGSVGDVDLFYFLCYARDMNLGHEIPENVYSYFPGVYTFWRSAILVSGESLAALETWHLGLVAMNCILVGLLLWRLTHCLPVALFAASWTLLLYSRFQGLEGTSEPLATLPLLATFCYWNGKPIRGRNGLLYCLALGAGFGLALYGKQQAGLLSLGAVMLLIESLGSSRRHDLRILATLPLFAVATLLLAILGEGEGLAPLWKGLSVAAGYGQEGSWLHNIYVQVRRDETAALAALLSAAVLCWWGLHRRTPDEAGKQQLSVAGMLAISGLATLLQLRNRAFHHYMLLAVPCLVVSSTLAWHHLWSWRTEALRTGKAACLALLLLPLVPFLIDSGVDESFLAGRLPRPVERVIPIRWHQREKLRDDLEQVRQQLPPRSSILLVPARHNSIHFLLGTSSAASSGYHFQLRDYTDGSWIDQLSEGHKYVLVQHHGLDSTDRKRWGITQQRRAHRRLMSENYEVLVEGKNLVLYQHRD